MKIRCCFLFLDIPDELRAQAIKLAIILMPDENREALQTVLTFLSHFAENAVDNQVILDIVRGRYIPCGSGKCKHSLKVVIKTVILI